MNKQQIIKEHMARVSMSRSKKQIKAAITAAQAASAKKARLARLAKYFDNPAELARIEARNKRRRGGVVKKLSTKK